MRTRTTFTTLTSVLIVCIENSDSEGNIMSRETKEAEEDLPLEAEDWEDGLPDTVEDELSDDNDPDWLGRVEQRETVGGSQDASYENLESPAIVKIPVVHCHEHTNPGADRQHVSGTIRGETVRQLPWVLCDANPREPSHNKVVSDIQDTALNEPEEMQCRNGGLTNVASFSHYDDDDQALYLGLQSREGLVNGGHTQLALSTLENQIGDEAVLEFEVIILESGLEDAQRVRIATKIAETRNYEQELEERSRADHRGFYDPIKQRLDPRLISWHENDSEVKSERWVVPSDHFIRLLDLIDPNKYVSVYNETASGHGSPTTGKSGPHGDWFDRVREIAESNSSNTVPKPFEHLYPMVPAVLELRDGISASLHDADLTEKYGGGTVIKRTSLWQDYIRDDREDEKPPTRPLYSSRFADETGVYISTTLEALLLGYLRGNIWLPGTTGEVTGWFNDPLAVWEEHKVRRLSMINEAVDFSGHGGVTFSRSPLLFHENQLFGPDPRGDPPESPPEIVHDDTTRARYFLISNGAFDYDVPTLVGEDPSTYDESDATHYLDADDGELVEITSDVDVPEGVPMYRIDTNQFFPD